MVKKEMDEKWYLTTLKVIFVSIAYFVSARIGLSLQFDTTQASPVWPPTGIAIIFVYFWARPALLGVFLGAFLANLIDFALKANSGFSLLDLSSVNLANSSWVVMSSFIGLGNTLESYLFVKLYEKYCLNGKKIFTSLTQVKTTAFFGFLAGSCLVSALIGTTSLVIGGVLPSEIFYNILLTWWIGDLSGGIVLAPIFLFFNASEIQKEKFKKYILYIGSILLYSLVSFSNIFNIAFLAKQAYVLIPILLISCYFFSSALSFVAVGIVNSTLVILTINGYGPFIRDFQNESLILLQGFVIVSTLTVMYLRFAILQQKDAEKRLEQFNLHLESLVKKRTEALEKSNKALAQSNKDLDDFAYIASHDLKEPLRGIDNSIDFLVQDHGDKIGEDGLNRCQKMRNSAEIQ